jgi:hypothetical protein
MGWLLAIAAVVVWLSAALAWSRGWRPGRGSRVSPLSVQSARRNYDTGAAGSAPFFLGGSGWGGGDGGSSGGGGGDGGGSSGGGGC